MKKQIITTLVLASLSSQISFADGLLTEQPKVAATEAPTLATSITLTELPNDGLVIEDQVQALKSKAVNEKLSGYKVVVRNTGNKTLQMINTQIANGMNGQQAYEYVKKNTAGRAIGWGLGVGILSFGLGFLIAAPIAAATGANANSKARNATIKFDNSLSTGPLPPGGSVETFTFVPLGTKPQLRLTYKEAEKQEIKFLSR